MKETVSKSSGPSVSAGDSVVSFESRLVEARARREKVLAERGAQSGTLSMKPTEKLSSDAQKPKTQQADQTLGQKRGLGPLSASPSMTPSLPSKSLAVKAMLVLIAAVGFGFGSTLAARMLSVPPEAAVTSEVAANVAPQASDIKQPTEAASLTISVSTLTDRGPYVVYPEATLVPPDVSSEEAAPTLEFSKAKFTRAEIKPLDTNTLRNLPDQLTLEAGKIATLTEGGEPVRVFVHAPDGVPQNALDEYVAELNASGARVATIGREPFRVSKTHLRFYSEDNAQNARSLARSLDIEARNFSQSGASLDRIEVWVAGQPLQVTKNEPEPTNLLRRVFRSFTEGAE